MKRFTPERIAELRRCYPPATHDVQECLDEIVELQRERDEWQRLREDSLSGWNRASAMLLMAENQREEIRAERNEYIIKNERLTKRLSKLEVLANDTVDANQDPLFKHEPYTLLKSLMSTARWALAKI